MCAALVDRVTRPISRQSSLKTSLRPAYQRMKPQRQSEGQSVTSLEGNSRLPVPGSAQGHSYGQILKSSALIGGASTLNIAIGIVRTKAMAVLLGPAGFGLLGVYASIIDLAVSVAGLGVASSGVRQIAVSVASGDNRRIASTATILR